MENESRPAEALAPARGVATLVSSREADPARVADFERALADTVQTALRFPGHLGITVIRPPAGAARREYRIVVKFDSRANLDRWLASEESARCFARIAEHEARPARIETATGLEAWFEVPDAATASDAPPRHKMALATWLASFPVITFWLLVLHPILRDAPLPVRTLVLSGLMVVSLTYVVMPWLTRRLSRWLYAEPGDR